MSARGAYRTLLVLGALAVCAPRAGQACWCILELGTGCGSCQSVGCALCNNGSCSGTTKLCQLKNALYDCESGFYSWDLVVTPCFITYNCHPTGGGQNCTLSGCSADLSTGVPDTNSFYRFVGVGSGCVIVDP
jgi:hypothetical protein